jgi:hypothetical protein
MARRHQAHQADNPSPRKRGRPTGLKATINETSSPKSGRLVGTYFALVDKYRFDGFFRPVDNLPTFNVAKAGSAIQVKFALGGDKGLNLFVAGYPQSTRIACDTSEPQDEIKQTVSAGSSSLSYDASAGLYAYAWKTDKGWAGTCRQLSVLLVDGTKHLANFKFK